MNQRKQKTITGLATAALTTMILTSCSSDDAKMEAPPADLPTIITSTNILGDVTEQILQDLANVVTLMPANADPHSFTLSASEAHQLEQADLIIVNGSGLEHGIEANIDAAESAGIPVFSVTDHLDLHEFADDEHAHEDEHADEHDHDGVDPHFWTDPLLVKASVEKIVEAILDTLPEIDGDQLAAQGQEYAEQLDALNDELTKEFQTLSKDQRKLVTGHEVLNYFAERYDFEIIGAIIPSSNSSASPSPAQLERLRTTLLEEKVSAVFVEFGQTQKLADALAKEAQGDGEIQVIPLYSESLGEAGSDADTYIGMMQYNAQAIIAGLSN